MALPLLLLCGLLILTSGSANAARSNRALQQQSSTVAPLLQDTFLFWLRNGPDQRYGGLKGFSIHAWVLQLTMHMVLAGTSPYVYVAVLALQVASMAHWIGRGDLSTPQTRCLCSRYGTLDRKDSYTSTPLSTSVISPQQLTTGLRLLHHLDVARRSIQTRASTQQQQQQQQQARQDASNDCALGILIH